MLLDAIAEGLATDVQFPGGLGDIAVRQVKRLPDQCPLDLLQIDTLCRNPDLKRLIDADWIASLLIRNNREGDIKAQGGRADFTVIADQEGPLHHVRQLAHVAGPSVLSDGLQSGVRKTPCGQ